MKFWFIIRPKHKNKVQELLDQHWHINTVYRTRDGFLAEFLARDIDEVENFEEHLAPHADYQLVNVLKTIKEETFLATGMEN